MNESLEIWQESHRIYKERREKMQELMSEYDQTVFYPAKKALRERCEKETGHNMQFVDTNPVGYPVFTCSTCGYTKIGEE